jgi:AcrR family transcriptional regulator
VRPTRGETRQRVFAAAAGVFAEVGVAAASIELIAAAAGFTRGAFYSNFTSKHELAIAMLEDHLAHSQVRNRALLAEHPDATGFVQALEGDEGPGDDPLHRHPLLQVELMLYVARTPDLRPLLGEHLRQMRTLVGEIAASIVRSGRPDVDVDPEALGTVLVAVEDGLRLHRLIDPDSTPEDAFPRALGLLQALVLAGGDTPGGTSGDAPGGPGQRRRFRSRP